MLNNFFAVFFALVRKNTLGRTSARKTTGNRNRDTDEKNRSGMITLVKTEHFFRPMPRFFFLCADHCSFLRGFSVKVHRYIYHFYCPYRSKLKTITNSVKGISKTMELFLIIIYINNVNNYFLS